MKIKLLPFVAGAMLITSVVQAQTADPVVSGIVKEATENSQLRKLAHELLDVIGPRLVGSPQIQQAHEWAVDKYAGWGISAKNEQWGTWRGWERGVSHIDMVYPRVKSLEGMQLAWSPGTKGKDITAETIILPLVTDSIAFQKWLPNAKGKIVMISMNQPTGRPEYNWTEFATKESFDKIKAEKAEETKAWAERIKNTGFNAKSLALALEKAGAAAIMASNWSNGFGVNKIFGANTTKIPTVDIALEDYGLLFRLTEGGSKPKVRIKAESKELGAVPTFNTIASIKGSEKPNEYVILSAHFDSWDGGTGATDNGTGTIVMMEAMRILKSVYPNPKRTILVGHWSSEEQGLNGSRAFVEDHPEVVNNLQALFNQDNGTGRIVNISGQGFAKSETYLTRWINRIPEKYRAEIKTSFPGSPGAGGSDFASFVAAGAPGFSLSSLGWSYGNYTWHTNRDTFDKIVFDDVQSNAIVAAIMAYAASEDPERSSTEKSILPNNTRTGQPGVWPTPVKPNRKGGQ